MSESRVTLATFVPILVFLGLSVLELAPMYATDRHQTSDRRQTKHRLMPPPYVGGGIKRLTQLFVSPRTQLVIMLPPPRRGH